MTSPRQSGASSMSDEFWRHYRERKGGFLDDDTTADESIYQAWYLASHGKPTHLELVPAGAEDPEVWRISTLQTINHKYNRQTGELCLMLPTSDMMIFLEGRGLYELGELISDRRVSSIRAFDPTIHQPIGNDAVVITAIRVEQS